MIIDYLLLNWLIENSQYNKTIIDKNIVKVICSLRNQLDMYTLKNKHDGFFILFVYDIDIMVICNCIKPSEYWVGSR